MCDHLDVIYKILFIQNMIIPNKCVSGKTPWMTTEMNSYVSLEVLYTFKSSYYYLIVNRHKKLYHTCQVQPCLHGNNLSVYLTFLELSWDFQSGNYIAWTFITSIYLNLGLMSYNNHSYIEYLLSPQSSLLYGASCKWQQL